MSSPVAERPPAQAAEASPAMAYLIDELISSLQPPERLSIVEWAERYRWLPPGRAAIGGWWSWDVTPVLRGIANAINDPAVRRVVCRKSAQVGWTDGIINNTLGWMIDTSPMAAIAMFPKEQAGKDFSREKFEPMVESSGTLRDKLDIRSRSSENTQTYKGFLGGFLKLVGSNSSSSVKSTSARLGIVEEPDDCNVNIRGQGDSIKLIEERLKTFSDAKFLIGGTPTVRGFSSIDDEISQSNQQRFHVPCHECHDAAPLKWEHVHWDKASAPWHEIYGDNLPDTARYACPSCGVLWTDEQRIANVCRAESAGHGWKANAPFTGIAGFDLNELYSTFSESRMPRLVAKFLGAKRESERGNHGAMIAFVNSTLGESWQMQTDAPTEDRLWERALDYTPWHAPQGALAITAGVDIQHDRIAIEIVGWGRGEESWVIDAQEIVGEPLKGRPAHPVDGDIWWQLDRVLATPIKHASGIDLYVQAVSVDSGDGATTEQVYEYVRVRKSMRYMAIKGREDPAREIFSRPSQSVDVTKGGKAARHGLRPYIVGTHRAKDLFFGRLKLAGHGPGRIHWPRDIRGDFIRQLLAEVKFPGRGGKLTYQKKAGEPNEFLDCYIYAMHAARRLKLHTMTDEGWQRLESSVRQGDLLNAPKPAPAAPPAATAPPRP
ncbi:MAG: phage terminase large subunit family protein, partial [Salinisphaera sp.]|nr:phage terminase large subunit family protein [Salinisphaera sp.]